MAARGFIPHGITDSSLFHSLCVMQLLLSWELRAVYMGRCHSGVVCTLECCVSTDLCTLEYWASFFLLILSHSLFSSGGRNSGKAVEGNFPPSLSHTLGLSCFGVLPALVGVDQTWIVFVWMCDLDSEKEICCKMEWLVPFAPPPPPQSYQTSMR